MEQMGNMGGMGSLLGMLPGMNKIKAVLEEQNLEDKVFKKHRAMIMSMTPKERRNPKLLNASRKQRVIKGSGTTAFELNQLLKQHVNMQDMMKRFSKMGKSGLARHGLGALMGKNKNF
jgi:signal recognition particle subunit SRP54